MPSDPHAFPDWRACSLPFSFLSVMGESKGFWLFLIISSKLFHFSQMEVCSDLFTGFFSITHTHLHSLTHTHTHSLSHSHTLTHSLTHTHTHSHSYSHTHPSHSLFSSIPDLFTCSFTFTQEQGMEKKKWYSSLTDVVKKRVEQWCVMWR